MWLFPFARAWIWLGNGAGCIFVLGTAALYTYVLAEPLVSMNVAQLEPDILQFFQPTIWICYAVVVGHGILLVRTARRVLEPWWRAKRTATVQPSPPRSSTDAKTILTLDQREPSHTRASENARKVRTCVDRLAATIPAWWTRYQAEITRAFMLWEVANQTYQANKMSRLIASVWINRLVTVVIVVNCWFTPVLQYVMRSRPSTYVRLTRLLLDSCLDIMYSIGVPLVIFYPYYRDYLVDLGMFPVVNYYMDMWYASAMSELRQVFVTSWVDLVSKTTAAMALLHRLYVIENVLEEAQDLDQQIQREVTARGLVSVHQSTIGQLTVRVRSRLVKIFDALLLLWGLSIACIHIQSSIVAFHGDRLGCLVEIRPWGSSTYSCMVLEVSCVKRHIGGRQSEILDALDNVDPRFLQVLIVSHCPQLEVPAIVQDFGALSMVKVYNTTIFSWDETAAFRATTNPSLQVLYFARVNMSEIPTGLLAPDFPPGVWDIEFCVTNLTSVPDAAADVWQNIVYFAIEASPLLLDIPPAVLRLPSLIFLRLSMNGIRAIPDGAFMLQEFAFLTLDGNPINELPATIKTLKQMRMLGIQGTAVRNFPPDWIGAEPSLTGPILVTAYGSALCEAMGSPAVPMTIGPFSVNCLASTAAMIVYPITAEDKWRTHDQ